MTDLRLLPDAELVVCRYLRTIDEIVALCGDRVWPELPGLAEGEAEWRFPCVRIVRIGGTPILQYPLEIDDPLLQGDAWADDKATARRLAETVRAALAVMHTVAHDGAVVVGADIGALGYLPDEDFTPVKPRYTFDANVTMRPGSSLGS